MLSLEEALLLKAAQDEAEKEQAVQAAGILGGAGGAILGRVGGELPHQLGRAVNALKDNLAKREGLSPVTSTVPMKLKPGFRMAGGLTGAILGGALGAGTAAVMKNNNPAAQLLGKVQASGELTKADEAQLASLLAELYSNPSQM